jgi:mono/diheme cytochrome c family protein
VSLHPSVRWPRLLAGVLLLVAVTAGTALALVELRWKRRFDVPYPAIEASQDARIIARGDYLVYGAAACAYCHVPREEWGRLARGERLPLTGNHLFRLPFGEIYSANLTPDAATGIGRHSDREIARVLRSGVRADGRAAFPLMDFQLSDDDLRAIYRYLRSLPPSRNRTGPAVQLKGS